MLESRRSSYAVLFRQIRHLNGSSSLLEQRFHRAKAKPCVAPSLVFYDDGVDLRTLEQSKTSCGGR